MIRLMQIVLVMLFALTGCEDLSFVGHAVKVPRPSHANALDDLQESPTSHPQYQDKKEKEEQVDDL